MGDTWAQWLRQVSLPTHTPHTNTLMTTTPFFRKASAASYFTLPPSSTPFLSPQERRRTATRAKRAGARRPASFPRRHRAPPLLRDRLLRHRRGGARFGGAARHLHLLREPATPPRRRGQRVPGKPLHDLQPPCHASFIFIPRPLSNRPRPPGRLPRIPPRQDAPRTAAGPP